MSGLEQGFSVVASTVVQIFREERDGWGDHDFKDRIFVVSLGLFCGVPAVLGRFLYAIIKEVLRNELNVDPFRSV